MGISSYSTTPASNTSLFPEGMARSSVNDSARQVQADIRSWYETAEWVDYGYTPTYASTTSFTMSGDRTSFFTTGRRIKCTDSSTLYGVIASSSFGGGNTTVNVTLDSGSLSASLTAVALSILSVPLGGTNSSISFSQLITGDSTSTLTNKTLTAPKFADLGYIADSNGNEMLIFDSDSTAVNEFTISNKATLGTPTISVTGSDSTIAMGFQVKGDSAYNFYGTTATSAEVRLFEDTDNGTNYIGIKAPSTITANKTWVFPESDTTNGYLKSNGSGVLSVAALTGFVQQVRASTTAVATGTTTIPDDDTIPQNTEGDQYLTATITPTSASSVLVIEASINASNSAGGAAAGIALFQDSTANALAAMQLNYAAASRQDPFVLTHYMTAGTTSATTFKIRLGSNNAGTTTVNGVGGARKYGGVCSSTLIITEYSA